MKILIAGLGSIGRRHLHNLLALGESDILLYRTHHSTLPDEELAGFPVETDLAVALAYRPVAVIVSNPTALHLQVAIPAAEAGCHLLLEKPISHTMEGVDRLQKAVRRGGGQVLTGFQFRFHPGLQTVRRLLNEGAIGRPLSVRAHWGEHLPGWHPWEDYRLGYSARADLGGGVVLTLCHSLDYLRWLIGEVAALWAFSDKLSDLELQVEDTAEIGLRFTSKAIGSLHLDFNQRPPAHHLEITGTQGTIRWDNGDGAVHAYRSASEKWDIYQAPEGFTRNDLFLAQLRHFLAVAHGESTPLCTLEDGVRALQLALAVHESQQAGQLIHFQAG
jgi:predicted dehydrogenase